MSNENHTPHKNEFFRRIAFDCGYLITSEQEMRLIALPTCMRQKFGARLSLVIESLRCVTASLPHGLEQELLKFLSPEILARLHQEQSSFLLHWLKQLQVADLKTEVLMKWKAEIETSDSSSIQDGESLEESEAPPRAETVVPSCSAVTEQGTHGRTDDEARS